MQGPAARLLPYALAFTSSLCIMILELVSSRLVARHVGSSLTVWTSVIGIILGGICLGNVLGGRLADRVDPRRAVGPLFALGALLTLGSLWVNAEVGQILPHPDQMNWELRTVLVVLLDFLIPATVLGMVGPVVAKMAVEQATRAGSAIGDVYFWGAIGSIAGTFLSGFVLIYLVPTSTIVVLVAAALALLAAALSGGRAGLVFGVLTALCLILGSINPLVGQLPVGAVDLGSYQLNSIVLAGNVLACVLAVMGLIGLVGARRGQGETADAVKVSSKPLGEATGPDHPRPGLADLAVLAFVASLVFMALEMVAGRLVTRHLGSSIYGWTSVIAVLLAGLSLGNFLGGKIADFVKNEKHASWLFLFASMLTLTILVFETPPKWFGVQFLGGSTRSVLSSAVSLTQLPLPGGASLNLSWPYRILLVVTMVFFLPSLSMGTVSPVVAKLAVDRLKRYQRTGTAIGQVYAWGMVGSILGTFLTGFFLIDTLGTKGVILVLGTTMAFGATMLGSLWHAIWAGIPLGLCVIAFTPPGWVDRVGSFVPFIKGDAFRKIGLDWGIREKLGDPQTTPDDLAWVDESDYYYIKIENDSEDGGEVQKRTLVLDNLIHGYFILDHPERLDYDYEHIYALVAYRAAKASGKVTFKPASEPSQPEKGATTDRREAKDGDESRPAPPSEPSKPGPSDRGPTVKSTEPKEAGQEKSTKPAAGLKSVAVTTRDEQGTSDQEKKDAPPPGKGGTPDPQKKDLPGQDQKVPARDVPGSSQPARKDAAAKDQTDSSQPDQKDSSQKDQIDLSRLKKLVVRDEERPKPYIPAVETSSLKSLFLGGGAYCFQRHMQFAYPGTGVDVAEIDPAVKRANHMATGLPENTPIQTYLGDARQFVELHQDTNQYDLIFGDAFNDFSVPWHLTTREFNEKINKMMSPTGVYMINIIDLYESDARALSKADEEIADGDVSDLTRQERIRLKHLSEAHRCGGFLGAWTKTAKLTFPHVYIFGTDEPGKGLRETFVVVASKQKLDLDELGLRKDDPRFYTPHGRQTQPKTYGPEDEKTVVEDRSRNIILTDDYAPVENLLAPVAETRGDD
jgi:hypothetical protein